MLVGCQLPDLTFYSKLSSRVSSIQEAKVVCILDKQHGNEVYLKHLGEILSKHFNKEKDIYFTEQANDLADTDIHREIEKRSPKKAIVLQGINLKGWDHPRRNEWLNQIDAKCQPIEKAIETFENIETTSPFERITAFAQLSACSTYVNRKSNEEDVNNFLGDKVDAQLQQNITRLITAGKAVLALKTLEAIKVTFPLRQNELIRTTKQVVAQEKEKDSKIYIDMGSAHADSTFLNTLVDIPHILINLGEDTFR